MCSLSLLCVEIVSAVTWFVEANAEGREFGSAILRDFCCMQGGAGGKPGRGGGGGHGGNVTLHVPPAMMKLIVVNVKGADDQDSSAFNSAF